MYRKVLAISFFKPLYLSPFMKTTNQNRMPDFTLSYQPWDHSARPQNPLEEAIEFLYRCARENESQHNPQSLRKEERLHDIVNNVLPHACEEGNQDSFFWMFFAYANGVGVETDVDKGLEYLRTLAEQGYTNMQYSLGQHYATLDYENGAYRRKMRREGIKWLTKAAEQGAEYAMCELGKCYKDMSFELRRNARKAKLWLRMAAKRGDEEAQWALENIRDWRRNSKGSLFNNSADMLDVEQTFMSMSAATHQQEDNKSSSVTLVYPNDKFNNDKFNQVEFDYPNEKFDQVEKEWFEDDLSF